MKKTQIPKGRAKLFIRAMRSKAKLQSVLVDEKNENRI